MPSFDNYQPDGQESLFLSFVVSFFMQNDLWTFVLSTFPSRWYSCDLELFEFTPFVSWDLHPSFHWKPSSSGHPDVGLGIPYVPDGQRNVPGK